ncbi:hypothetical protein IFM89_007402 [Coptis chinensis]|uniref:ClpA/ClpB AAA lid domain-containing protein n=1 Tax=Coptis chinensis TaxID=261450 RepID=A0A835IKL3_9MAGN|nr:hypothetical protein IFM89_007402 [Coptis chinensis]
MWNPLSWVMEAAAIMAIALANGGDFMGIITLLVINSTISFIEENNVGNASRSSYGDLAPKAKESKFLKFLGFMWNPLSWVMEAAAIMAIALANGGDFVGIITLPVINSTISFIEENNAGNLLLRLLWRRLAPKKAKVFSNRGVPSRNKGPEEMVFTRGGRLPLACPDNCARRCPSSFDESQVYQLILLLFPFKLSQRCHKWCDGRFGNLLKPMLGGGELRCIGATTLSMNTVKYIEKDPALERRFQQVYVDQPSVEDTISILRGLRERYELHHGVRISNSALVAPAILRIVVEATNANVNMFLPAIDLVDEAVQN